MFGNLRQLFNNPATRPVIVKTVIFVILLGIIFYATFGMAKSYLNTRSQKKSYEKELKDMQVRLDTIVGESTKNDEFQKEKIVREKLHLTRPGEDLIVIIPKE